MPISIECKCCGKSYRVADDKAGKRIRCRECSWVFDVPDRVETVESEGDVEPARSPRRRLSKPRSGNRSKTRSGGGHASKLESTQVSLAISLVFYSLQLTALCVFLDFGLESAVGIFGLLLTLQMMQGVVVIAIGAHVLNLVGKGLCLSLPDTVPGKGWIYAALALEGLSTVFSVGPLNAAAPYVSVLLSTVSAGCSFVCFLFFLQLLGRFIDSSELADRARSLIRIGVGFFACWVLSLSSPFVLPIAPVLFGVPALILGVMGLLRYWSLLQGFRASLATS